MERTDPDRALLPEKWAQAKAGEDAAAAWLVHKYHWLSLKLAHGKRVPPTVDREDVISWANWGLFDAMRKFQPDQNTDGKLHEHFIGFATMRINGAILDGLKAPGQTWATREVWRQMRKMKEAEEELEQQHGRMASRAELAAHMGVTEKSLPLFQQQIPLTSVGPDGEEGDHDIDYFLHDPMSVEGESESSDMLDRMAAVLSALPAEQQQLLAEVYVTGETNERAARSRGISVGELKRRRQAALLQARDLLQG